MVISVDQGTAEGVSAPTALLRKFDDYAQGSSSMEGSGPVSPLPRGKQTVRPILLPDSDLPPGTLASPTGCTPLPKPGSLQLPGFIPSVPTSPAVSSAYNAPISGLQAEATASRQRAPTQHPAKPCSRLSFSSHSEDQSSRGLHPAAPSAFAHVSVGRAGRVADPVQAFDSPTSSSQQPPGDPTGEMQDRARPCAAVTVTSVNPFTGSSDNALMSLDVEDTSTGNGLAENSPGPQPDPACPSHHVVGQAARQPSISSSSHSREGPYSEGGAPDARGGKKSCQSGHEAHTGEEGGRPAASGPDQPPSLRALFTLSLPPRPWSAEGRPASGRSVEERCAEAARRLMAERDRCDRLSRKAGRRLEAESRAARDRAKAQMQQHQGE